MTGEGCAQFDGKGTKCKKQKGCRWTAEVEYDKDGKCVPVEASEQFLADYLDPSDDETNEELLAEFLDNKVAFEWKPFQACFPSIACQKNKILVF